MGTVNRLRVKTAPSFPANSDTRSSRPHAPAQGGGPPAVNNAKQKGGEL
jgi:hypothetical protein